MKKTISALLMTALLPLSVADSLAATSGTINFTGAVAEGTCTVQDLNNVFQLKNISAEEANNANHGAVIMFDTIWSYFSVTGCPASLSKVKIRFDFEPEANPEYLKLSAGSTEGIALRIPSSGQGYTKPGDTRTLSLINGSASSLLQGALFRNVNDADMGVPALSVTEGTYSAVANLSMSFE